MGVAKSVIEQTPPTSGTFRYSRTGGSQEFHWLHFSLHKGDIQFLSTAALQKVVGFIRTQSRVWRRSGTSWVQPHCLMAKALAGNTNVWRKSSTFNFGNSRAAERHKLRRVIFGLAEIKYPLGTAAP